MSGQRRLVERLNRVVPRWRLNGWSCGEMEDMTEDLTSVDDDLGYHPNSDAHAGFAEDGVSGFARLS